MLLRAIVHLARAVRRWLTGIGRGDSELAANGRCYTLEFFPGLFAGLGSTIRPPGLDSAPEESNAS
jgi:hypothetical protein